MKESEDRLEQVDMGLFAAAPEFRRLSMHLAGIDAAASAKPARRMLQKASRDAVVAAPPPATARWREVYAATALPEDSLTPPAALRAWAARPQGVPSQGPVLDLLHALALRHGLPVAAYDLAAVQGGLWLRPARGTELFEPIEGKPETVPINEPILGDDGGHCLARAWHGRQSAPTVPRPTSTEVLVHVDTLDMAEDSLEALADELRRLLTGFVGGVASHGILHRGQARLRWPASVGGG